MARYIDADMLLKELEVREIATTIQTKQGDKKHRICQRGILSGLNWSRNIIYEIPTADVVEAKHGEWKIKRDDYDYEYMKCSCCKEEFYPCDSDTVDETPNYCPHCGVKMDGERRDT